MRKLRQLIFRSRVTSTALMIPSNSPCRCIVTVELKDHAANIEPRLLLQVMPINASPYFYHWGIWVKFDLLHAPTYLCCVTLLKSFCCPSFFVVHLIWCLVIFTTVTIGSRRVYLVSVFFCFAVSKYGPWLPLPTREKNGIGCLEYSSSYPCLELILSPFNHTAVR